ncbi:MAG: nucleoside deaminase [candidate division Zixibacteria bacterium]|nr:nucleoside deaminase [candidate division Zixibacteria bacterium]
MISPGDTFDYERATFFMRQALREAEQAFEEKEVPVGAVVVKEGFVVGRGHNQMERLGDPTAHAEIVAIGAAAGHFESWRLLGATLYCTIEPCIMCAGAAVMARVDRIVYGAADPKFGGCDSIFRIPTDPRLNHRVQIVSGVLADEAAALMRRFFATRRTQQANG